MGLTSPANAADTAADAQPDRVILTPTENPSNSQSFTWRTGADVTDGAVNLREVGAVDWVVVDAALNGPLDGEGGVPTRTHSATATGLEPGTKYEYYVGNVDAQSATWQFTTAAATADPFTFVYFGDAQTDLGDSWGPVVEAAFDRYPEAAGSVHAGDLIDRSNSVEWSEWFAGMDGVTQTTNVIAAPGNHEYTGDALLERWKSNFEYPANGPIDDSDALDGSATPAQQQEAAYRAHMAQVLTETVYFTDYQGVRFISLNATHNQVRAIFTPPDLPDCLIGCPDPAAIWLDMQADWLDEILQNNPNQWAVATFHQPVFSTAMGRDERVLRDAWLPVLQRGDIDLVLMGHDHGYARGFVNDDATDLEGVTTGPVYAVSVAGPLYFPQQPAEDNVWLQNDATPVVRASETSTFQGITVDGGSLHYEAIVAAKGSGASTTVGVGDVLDSFTITKYPNGEKFVTEAGVAIPPQGDGSGSEPPGVEPPVDPPAEVPLNHYRIGTLTSPTVHGPTAFDEATGILYVADESPTGTGKVEAIDVVTDTVLRSFEVGTPVTAMSFMNAEGGRLLIASQPKAVIPDVLNGRANAYSVNPAFFGLPMIADDMKAKYAIRGLGIDSGSSLVYLSLTEDRHIGVVVMATGDALKPSLQTRPYGLKVDDATGHLFVAERNLAEDASYLRMYTTDEMLDTEASGGYLEPETSIDLSPHALNVDLDRALGLAYVSHGGELTSGVSVVDVATKAVTFLDSELTGSDVLGLAVSPRDERIYVSTDESITVLSRGIAPRITSSPESTTITEGDETLLSAEATAVPAATVQWQRQTTEGAWVDIDGAASGTYTATPAATTQYRAVFVNEIGGEEFSAVTDAATVEVLEPPVLPGEVTKIELSVSAATVLENGSLTFTVTGTDSEGNTFDVTDDVVLSSSVATDEIRGNRVIFWSASPHTITATHVPTGVTTSVTIEVTPFDELPRTGGGFASMMTLGTAGLALITLGGLALWHRARTRAW